MLKIKIIAAVLFLTAFVSSCIQVKTPPKTLNCPPLVQGCGAYKWEGLAVDTSEAYKRVADWYYVFENLKRVNSPEDEWALSFIDSKRAILTFTDGNEQRIMILRMSGYNLASVESGVGVPMDGNIGSMSVKGSSVVLASSPPKENLNTYTGNSGIYTADLNGNILINVKNLDTLLGKDNSNWDSHPAYSPDKNVIFFTSDRQPYLGTEIYYTIKMPDGNWSLPINCGDSVNSNCDELTPFVSNDGKTLLFASCGHESIGGYDIFSSVISDDFWQLAKKGDYQALLLRRNLFGRAVNLRPPLNTKFDELFPSTPGDFNDVLYYSSNQTEGYTSIVLKKGGFDIYVRKKELSDRKIDYQRKEIATDIKVELNIDENKLREAKVNIPQKYSLEGRIYNAKTHKLVPMADLIVRKIKSDQPGTKETIPETNEIELSSLGSDLFYDSYKMKSDSSGDYKVELDKGKDYEVTAQADNLFYESIKIRIEKNDTTTIVHRDFYVPVNLTLRVNFPTNVYNNPYKYTIDSNGVETNNLWEDEINNVAKNLIISKDRIAKVVLVGNTDDVGTVAFNEKLGLNRVNFVIQELVKRGIPAEMLEGQSAGKMDPLPQNPGEPIQLYRKRLRRVELHKVLKH